MRTLYHFEMSTFSRRTRLALAHKRLEFTLKDGRADAAHLAEAHRLTPIRTMPVLDDDGRIVADSGAIAQYLDLAYPDRPRLFPSGAAAHDALAITTWVDVAVNALVELGTRFWPLHDDAAWAKVRTERMDRAQVAIEAVAARATRPVLAGDAWSVADIWTLSATHWIAGLPTRAAKTPMLVPIVSLGLRLPDALVAWAKQHDDRPEVRALYG